MAEHSSPYIYDVTDQNFMSKAVEASQSAVVIVDFWADWCGPCKMLGPLLEQIVNSYNGQVLLAKVDVDNNQRLAAQFGVRSIPTVKILQNGEIVNEFVGVQQEPQIRAMLDELTGGGASDPLVIASELMASGKIDDAAALYRALLAESPENPDARIGLARVAITQGDSDAAQSVLETFNEGDESYSEARALLDGLGFVSVCHAAGTPEEIKQKAVSNPDDLDAQYTLGCCYAASGNFEGALETFLEIVRKNKSFADGKALNAMKSIFEIIGQQDPLTGEYRGRLANLLF